MVLEMNIDLILEAIFEILNSEESRVEKAA